MKKTFFPVLSAALLIASILLSCKKKETSPEPTPEPSQTSTTTGGTTTGNGQLSYNDGNSITVDSANATLYTNSVSNQRHLDVYGFKSGKQVVEFHFKPITGAQTVAQNFNGAWLTYLTNNGLSYPNDYYNCTTGNFNLTTCDTVGNKLIGTFDFVGSNSVSTKTISAGTINIDKIKKQ